MSASRIEERLGEVFCLEPVNPDSEMRITDNALDSVVYVGALLDRDPTPENFMITGTGFFVAHKKTFFIVIGLHPDFPPVVSRVRRLF
jgi:hypothetical protein